MKKKASHITTSDFRDERYLLAFGNNLRQIRIKKGLSMSAVLDKVEGGRIEINSLYRIEKGKVNTSICIVKTLAKALDVLPSELFNFSIK